MRDSARPGGITEWNIGQMEQSEAISAAITGSSSAKQRRTRRPSLGNDAFLMKALEVFYEKGFAGTSIDAITAAAGIGKKTIYDRYGDKESLFKAAIEYAIDVWNVPVARLREAECDNLEESLLAIGRILVDNILTPSGLRLLRLTNAEAARLPHMGEHNIRYGQDPVIDYLADLFTRQLPVAGKASAGLRDVAEAFLHLVVGGPATAAAWGVIADQDAIERRLRLSVSIFAHGLLMVSGQGVSSGELARANAALNGLEALLTEGVHKLNQARRHLSPGPHHDE